MAGPGSGYRGEAFVGNRNSVLIAAAGIMLSTAHTPALAQAAKGATAPPQGVTITGQRPDRDKMVCKSEAMTGSIMPQKVCKSKGAWEEDRDRALVMIQRLKEDRAMKRNIRDQLDNRP
jgi:hypothetical protein